MTELKTRINTNKLSGLSKAMQVMDTLDLRKKTIQQSNIISDAFKRQLTSKFETYASIHFNYNTKGSYYEKVIAHILNDYLGSRFDFQTRTQLIDANMRYLEIFEGKTSEVDIVGVFKNASPRIILSIGETHIVPYDAAALLLEVKSKMDANSLSNDLQKLQKLSLLPNRDDRFFPKMTTEYNVMYPLRILFYLKRNVDENKFKDLLERYIATWDAIFILQKDTLIINKRLPFFRLIMKALGAERFDNSKYIVWTSDSFIMFLSLICYSIPSTIKVDAIPALISLAAIKYAK